MSYTPKYPEYGAEITKSQLTSLSEIEYVARGINGEAGYENQTTNRKAVAKVLYNRKESGKSYLSGEDYKEIAGKAFDALKNPNNNVLDPRRNDLSSEIFDQAIDAAKALIESDLSYL